MSTTPRGPDDKVVIPKSGEAWLRKQALHLPNVTEKCIKLFVSQAM
jgi:hypothetical protein